MQDDVVPGVVVVKVRHAMMPDAPTMKAPLEIEHALRARGALQVSRTFPQTPPVAKSPNALNGTDLSHFYTVALTPGSDPLLAAKEFSRLPGVEYAEPKYRHRLFDTPNDPGLPSQSAAFTQMQLFDGWSVAKGAGDVVIAVVDGGTYWQHEDIGPNLWINLPEDVNGNGRYDPGSPPAGDEDGVDQDGNGYPDDVVGWNFTRSSGNPNGLSSTPGSHAHGTATASHLGAVTNNGTGMAGTSWNCTVLPVCVASATGDGFIDYGYEGIVYAAQNGAKVINCSWGREGGYSRFEEDIVAAATTAGALVVAASGNDANDNDLNGHYPSGYMHVLCVGGTNSTDDVKWSLSNYGTIVRVFAPASNIFSAFVGGGYGNGGSGTSYASSQVAGIAGILRAQNPAWTPQQVAAQLRATADPIDAANPSDLAGRLGSGRVNALRAFSESRPALDVVQSSVTTPQGKKIFLIGDTIAVSVAMRNVLFTGATNVQFTVSATVPSLQVVTGSASVPAIAAGEEVQLPTFLLRVLPISDPLDAVIRLRWVGEGMNTEGTVFKVTLFPSLPLWTLQEAPIAGSLFSVKPVDSSIVWAAGGNRSATNPVVIRTTDGGKTWQEVAGNLAGVDLYCIAAVDSSRAWVGTGNGKIFATTNGGGGWEEQPYPGVQSPFINGITFLDAQNGYAVGDPSTSVTSPTFIVLRTSNGGATWEHMPKEPVVNTGEAGWNNSVWWAGPRHGWFGTNGNKIWRTSDAGASWQSSPSGASSAFGIAFLDSLNGLAGHENGSVARTSDGGTTWSNSPSGSTFSLVGLAYPGPGAGWTADGLNIFLSTDGGQLWSRRTRYPIYGQITHLAFADTGHGWAVTSAGEVLKYGTTAGTDTSDDQETVPESFVLEQNFPNPFNPGTTIRFTLPAASSVALRLYDVLGREVATLLNEDRVAGTHDVRFDGSSVASGIYFCRFQGQTLDGSTRFDDVRKLVLLR